MNVSRVGGGDDLKKKSEPIGIKSILHPSHRKASEKDQNEAAEKAFSSNGGKSWKGGEEGN